MNTPLEPGQGSPGLWTLIPPTAWDPDMTIDQPSGGGGGRTRPYADNAGNLVIPAGYTAAWIPATPGTIAAVSSIGGGALVDFAPEGSKILGETADGKVIVLDEIPDASDPIIDLGELLTEVAQAPIPSDGFQEALQAGRNLIEQQHQEHAFAMEATKAIESQLTAHAIEAQRMRDDIDNLRRQALDAIAQRQDEAHGRFLEFEAMTQSQNLGILQAKWAREDAEAIASENARLADAQGAAAGFLDALAKGLDKGERDGGAGNDHAAHRAAGRAIQEQVAAIARTEGRGAAEAYAAKEVEKFRREHPEEGTSTGGAAGTGKNGGASGPLSGSGLGGGSSLAGSGGASSMQSGFPWWLLLVGVALAERKR